MKKRITGVLLSLCLCLTLLPTAALAAATASETADFTDGDGIAALALLNAAKGENAEPSTWDSGTKTLTLKGLRFVTTAATAVKLPAGATIVLADGTHNTVIGGDAAVTQDGTYHNDIYIYGIYAAGDLTIQGGTGSSAGSLTVRSGAHTNTGDAWTYSTALYAEGKVTVEGGEIALTGGKARSADCAFSIGLELPNGSGLSVTGGSLTAKGGRSFDTGSNHASFSYGVYAHDGSSVSVTGSGKLTGDAEDKHAGLSSGISILGGDLTVSDSAEVFAYVYTGIKLSDGNLIQTGGTIRAGTVAGGYYGLSIDVDPFSTRAAGNITVSGGTLDVSQGKIDFSVYGANADRGNFAVSGSGTAVYARSISGAKQFTVTDATVRSGRIAADALTLSSGSLTVAESVQEYNGTLYADPALSLKKLTVNGGTLDVSWFWGGHTPIVLPVDESAGFSTPLVRMWGEDFVAAFHGGTATFNTGCAGNIVLKLGQLRLGEGIVETGAANTDTDAHTQAADGTPVKFSVFQRANVAVSGSITAMNKPYDGATDAQLDISRASLTGVTNGDDVELDLTGVSAAFADKNADTGKSVSVTGQLLLKGADAYKYALIQPDLSALTADITPAYAVLADTAVHTQTIRTGGGSSFRAPAFKGVGSEAATGEVSYTYNINDDTNLVYAITEDAILTLLNGLSAGDMAYIAYEFIGNGNYSSIPLTGTITVTMQAGSSPAPSAPSSSGSTAYPVSAAETRSGSVTVSPKNASQGSKVTITVKPDSGYTLESLTVTDANGNVLALTDLGDGKYSFVMPAGGVEVKATFMEDNSLLSFFYDVPNGAYYYEAVKWAVEKDITNGIGNSLFGSNAPCTRAQIVTFLWRAAGSPAPKGATAGMTDVASGSYYEKAVAWAIENGITTGTGEGTFSPDATCTRAQAVTFLARALNAKADSKAEFSDVPADSYFADAVAWAAASGVTDGVGNGLFAPGNDCTRAQIVTFLYRAYNK